jgi:flagellar hook-associated protein 3 FlgL
MTYISTMSLASPLQSSILQAQAALTQDQTEITTDAPADLGLTLGGQTGSVLSLKSQIDQLNAYSTSNSIATSRLSTTSTVLTSLQSTAQAIQSDLLTAQTTGGSTSSLATNVTNAMQTLISGLNTSANGEYIFGGINTDQTPMNDYLATGSTAKANADAAFSSAFGFSQTSSDAADVTGTQMQSFLDTTFASQFTGSGWSDMSNASSTTMQTAISPSQTTGTSVSANDTAFQQIAEAYAMVNEYAGANLGSDARQAVLTTASNLLSSGMAGLTNLGATVGAAQTAVTNADSEMTSQVTIVQTHVSDLDSVDTYALSTQVTDLTTQLQASYELTSRLQDLSLTNYLSST